MFWSERRKKWFWSMPVGLQPFISVSTMNDVSSVINQMDTSQAHLSSKGEKVKDSVKPDNLSKDELTAVLKYGAQKM